MPKLGPETAYIFRITHVNNMAWILQNGLHCQASELLDPNFEPIGMPDLIEKRAMHPVPIGPGGSLEDYVPFYFTPWSVMMLNIKTGYNGVIKRPNSDIAILVSSLYKLEELGVPFVFTDGHAYMQGIEFFGSMEDLGKIDWNLLRGRDFRNDPEDPGKLGRYMAETLVYRHVPVSALMGIVCYNTATEVTLKNTTKQHELTVPVKVLTDWYF